MLLFIGFLLVLLSSYLWNKTQLERHRFGVNDGRIIYSDIVRNERPLVSKRYGFSGKPDYLVQTKDGTIIPVEVKSGTHDKPNKHHVMQLIAYCQLVEESFERSVPYGLLVYSESNRRFRIPFDAAHISTLKQTLYDMHDILRTGEVLANHEEPGRCMHCSMKRYCNEAFS
ncbi:MAG: CRISPR-associated protein Cas4 [Candidatus Thermoplasmatota archaeon]|nr:CRISPR-associated protein Cas4 [Candidatus Thermoplasmatota archaeon]